MQAEEKFRDRIGGIKKRFISALDTRAQEFEGLLSRIVRNENAAEALEDLRIGVHKIRGVSPTLGLAKLGELATTTEQDINAMLAGNDPQMMAAKFLKSLNLLLDELNTTTQQP
jgi:chemotaxis protein histidine kinase CheA